MSDTINKNIIRLGWVSYFTDFATAIITPLLPVFVVTIMGAGADKLGIIIGVSAFISYFLRLLSGYISDRYQIVKPLVVAGYLLSSITKPLFGFSSSWGQVALLKSTERLGKALRSAPKDVMIKQFARQGQMGRSFGMHKALDIAGELSGAIVVFAVLSLWGSSEAIIRDLFLLTAIPGIIAVLILLFGVKSGVNSGDKSGETDPVVSVDHQNEVAPVQSVGEQTAMHRARQRWFKRPVRFSLRVDASLLPTLLCYFAMTLFIFDESFYLLRAQQLDFDLAWLPLLLIVSRLVQTLCSYQIGILVDKVGPRRMLSRAYLLAAVTGLSFLLPWNWAPWMGFAFLGLYTVMSLNAMRALIASEARFAGSSYGVFYAGTAVAAALGAMLAGVLWQWVGSEHALRISALGILLVVIMVLVVDRIDAKRVT